MGVNGTHGPSSPPAVDHQDGSVPPGVDDDEVARGLEYEIYRNGKHHREVAEDLDVSVDAVVWLMKRYSIGFSAQEPGAPPADLKAAVDALQTIWTRPRPTSQWRRV